MNFLLKFVFKVKLKKLLKKLLQYIIKYYKNYVLYNRFENKITFIKAPFVYGLRGCDIKLALNKMLKIIFFNLKKNNFKKNFFDKEVINNKASKKVLEAFRESKISLNILKFQNMKKQLLKD